MRVALITENFPPTGTSGVSSAGYNLYKLLIANDIEVKVFTFNDQPEKIDFEQNSSEVFHSGISAVKRAKVRNRISQIYKYQRKLFKKTDTYLTAYQVIDIVIANLGSRRLNKSLQQYKPEVVLLPDHGVPGFSIKKIPGVKVVHFSHHNPIRFIHNPFFGFLSEYDAALAVKIEKRALRKVDHVVCPSNYMKNVFINTFGECIPVTVIPNLMDNNFIEARKVLSVHDKICLSADYPLVYIPSGGSPYKGERYVVEIIRRLVHVYKRRIGFYVSGGLSSLQEEELSKLENVRNFVFAPGAVDNDENIRFIKSCKVCVSPTLIENFSMALLEANFCNLPVVTFDVGGNAEIISNGNNGFIVPYLDMESLIDRTVDIINGTPSMNAFSVVNDKFSTRKIGPVFIEFLQAL